MSVCWMWLRHCNQTWEVSKHTVSKDTWKSLFNVRVLFMIFLLSTWFNIFLHLSIGTNAIYINNQYNFTLTNLKCNVYAICSSLPHPSQWIPPVKQNNQESEASKTERERIHVPFVLTQCDWGQYMTEDSMVVVNVGSRWQRTVWCSG